MILVTHHAAERYIERVSPVTHDEAIAALSSPAIERAAAFGAPYVKLAGKQRVVLEGSVVVTVLPSDHAPGSLGRDRDWRYRRG